MKIRTQLIISVAFFAAVLAVISGLVITTNQHTERLDEQEELAKNIELKANGLAYLSNDYILYQDSQQIDRWKSEFSSFSNDVSKLKVNRPDQLALVNSIKANGQQLNNIFEDVVLKVESASDKQSTLSPSFIQVAGSRIGVKTQGIIFDTSRLAQLVSEEADQTQRRNSQQIFALIGAFLAFLFIDYLLIYRRTLKSISDLQDGTRVIGSGNLDHSIALKKGDEIGELAQAFNLMTANLKTVTASKADLEREIAERKEAEEALLDANQKYRALFNNKTVGLSYCQTIFDDNNRPIDYVVLDINATYEKLVGIRREQIVGKRITEAFPGVSQDLINRHNRVAVTGEDSHFEICEPAIDKWFDVNVFSPQKGYFVAIFYNITDRKRAEEELRLAYGRLQTFFDHRIGGIGIVIANAKGSILQANDYYLSILGCTREELLSAQVDWRKMTPPGWLPADERALAQLKERGVCDTYEKEYLRRDGTRVPVLITDAMMPGDSGDILAFVLDITERKKAEEALRESEARFRSVLDNSLDVIYRLNVQTGRYEYISPSAETVVGFSPDELMALDPETSLAMVHPDDLPAMRTGVARLGDTGIGELEYRQRTKNGDYRWISNHMSLIKDNDGQPLYREGNIRDITERKKAEEALRESEARFRSVLDSSRDAIYRFNFQTGRYDYVSPSGKAITGITADEFISMDVEAALATVHPDDIPAMRAGLAQSLDTGEVELEYRQRTKSGEYRWVSNRMSITRDGDGRPLYRNGSMSDITERKKAEEALRKAKDELELRVQERTTELLKAKEVAEAATKAKAEFLANMSHEIRTPMNSVIGFTELLLDDSDDPLSPEQKENLEAISMNGQALLTIINDILDFSKMESDKLVLEDQPFNLRQCVEESLDLVSVNASEKGLNLSYTIDKEVPDTIIGDPGRLRQVLGNLLSNAVKFTDEGEVTVSVSSQQIDGTNEVHFAVQDTGIGIPQDSMIKLFQPFNQLELSTTRLYGGTGLGLAISKKLVELMNGKIWAESQEGVGSTFHFAIKASSEQVEPKPAAVSPQLIGKSVLIVADNRTNRRILSKQVYDLSMVPVPAGSGQEALSWVQRGDDFDIAILDMDLQDMDALELEEKIRKYNKTLPLVLLTSLGKRVPPNYAYLIKPIKPSQLHKVLTEILPGTDILSEQTLSRQLSSGKPDKGLANVPGEDQPIQNKPLRILLAEDNISSQKVALQMLKKLGYRADIVANGIEVLQSLERQHYDVVLMDVKMPEMDGLDATRIIRQRWPDNGPRIIAITAYALKGDKERFIEAGMDDYISKPVQKEDLADALEKYRPEAQ